MSKRYTQTDIERDRSRETGHYPPHPTYLMSGLMTLRSVKLLMCPATTSAFHDSLLDLFVSSRAPAVTAAQNPSRSNTLVRNRVNSPRRDFFCSPVDTRWSLKRPGAR